MPTKSLPYLGAMIGAFVAGAAIPAGFHPFEVTFGAALALFVYSISGLLYFSAVGWPERTAAFDFYDLNHVLLSAVSAALLVSFSTAFALKVANTLSLSLVTSGLVAFTGVALLIGFGCSLVALARRTGG